VDAWRIRRELTIAAPPEAVWPWVARPELVSRWWCPPPAVTIRFEPRVNSRFEEHYRDGERTYDLVGTVAAYDPARRLAIRRDTGGRLGPADLIDITLNGDAAQTTVAIEHSFVDLPIERRGEAHDLYADGWSSSLALIGELVRAGDPPAGSTG
jgi:uncharacterized protein YndB with AHSA1/START domain